MNRVWGILLFLLSTLTSLFGQEQPVNLLEEALQEMNCAEMALGTEPRSYWSSYPHQTRYIAPAFDDLFANPLKIYPYVQNMANRIESDTLDRTLGTQQTFLSKIFYDAGLSNQIRGFRGFVPSLPETSESLEELIAKLDHFQSHRQRSVPHYKKAASDIPEWLRSPLANLLNGLAESLEYRQKAIRHVDQKLMERLFSLQRTVEIQEPEFENYDLIEDIMNGLDEQSLYASSAWVVRSCEQFVSRVDSLLATGVAVHGFDIEIETSLGAILVSDDRDRVYALHSPLLVVDFGGNDTYKDEIAASSIGHPISILIDFAGNDRYEASPTATFSQGAGIFGTGVLMDLSGDDVYTAYNQSQGFGLFGTGILYDQSGTDRYRMENSGQGCGYFGIGLNVDVQGDDHYYLFGDGQGMGGAHGTGVLINYRGTDVYEAEKDPEKTSGRADYHSNEKVNYNFAQGAGKGRRADLSHGHSWAGGLGALFDFAGNDTYSAGNFSQSIGYWFGTGVLYDKAGDDCYESVYFSQASAAHFAMSALLDLKGNDKHLLTGTSGAALSFGWDFCNTLLVDEAGDDEYDVQQFSIASSMIRSHTFFFEFGGNDVYTVGDSLSFFGACDRKEGYRSSGKELHWYEGKQHALFIDAGGDDTYRIRKGDQLLTHPLVKNNSEWSLPDSMGQFNNYFRGMDGTGKIPVENY